MKSIFSVPLAGVSFSHPADWAKGFTWQPVHAYVSMCRHARACTCSHLCSRGSPHWPGSWTPYKHLETRHCTPSQIQTCGQEGEKGPNSDFQVRCLSLDFRGQSHLSLRHNCQCKNWPSVRFTAALQQWQQHWVVLVAAVILCLVVQVGQQLNTLRRDVQQWADDTATPPSDSWCAAPMADTLRLCR